LRFDFDGRLDEMLRGNIMIFCGEKDVFYCDEKCRKYIKNKGIKLIEVAGAGHDWNEKFDEEIEKIIA